MIRELPTPLNAEGERRKVGVEIEFGSLDLDAATDVVRDIFGGEPRRKGVQNVVMEGSEIGDIQIVLDTALRKKAESEVALAGLELSRAVVPLEIVTAPVDPRDISRLDALRAALRAAGASGSRDGMLLGFGLHLNVEVPSLSGTETGAILTAYAFMEDWIRAGDQINMSRRILPFTDPYPRGFLDDLADLWPDATIPRLYDPYSRHNDTRNRGLDMLPILKHADPEGFRRAFGDPGPVSARPAFHYRLPDSRVDEGDWSLAYEWNRWVLVEQVAATPDAMDALATGWVEHRTALTTTRFDWKDRVAAILSEHMHQDAATAP